MSKKHQVAAIPVRRDSLNRLRVLLVTSRDTGRWVVPKGWPWPKVSDHKAAAGEAWEEAGVRGQVSSKRFGKYTYEKRLETKSRRVEVSAYLLFVEELAPEWPEATQRRRQWFSPEVAALLVDEPDLKQLLSHLAEEKRRLRA
ncbi:MAG: NUDIX hydrolase [Proteobacteria bacterium]|nr:NUDIX hydrolase [Pseudomonadota bacterium]